MDHAENQHSLLANDGNGQVWYVPMAHLVIIIIVKETDHQELCDMTRKEGRENSTDGTTNIGECGVGQDGESQTGESLKTFYATVDIWHQENVKYLCGRLHG